MSGSWMDHQRISDLRARVDYLESLVASMEAELRAVRESRAALARSLDIAGRRARLAPNTELTDLDREILEAIADGHGTTVEIREWLGETDGRIRSSLMRLQPLGLICRSGKRWIAV